MARRILPADGLLVPQTQQSLTTPVRAEPKGIMDAIHARWSAPLPQNKAQILFDWDNRNALMDEIDFVNKASAYIDEAAVKIAPSVLRIVLSVKANLPDAAEQRAFLVQHLEVDFRRISELCIMAEAYSLLEPDQRWDGAREIETYGWSKALKLSAVRDVRERQAIWERARGEDSTASYRAVLEELQRFRERQLIAFQPADQVNINLFERMTQVRQAFNDFNTHASHMPTRHDCQQALKDLVTMQKELALTKKAIQDHMESIHE